MEANFGGTEIYNPLNHILNSKLIEGYPKQIFVLTDGEVYNTESIINCVRKNVKYSRVHGIGIGSGASQSLIEGVAKSGKGQAVFIADHENPSLKIIQLLTESLTPVISKVQLSYDKTLVESVMPNPNKMPYILKNQLVNFFITFKGHPVDPTQIAL